MTTQNFYMPAERTSLDQLVHCPRLRCCFRQWHMRPTRPPASTKKASMYLQQLLSSPEDFTELLRLADGA